MGDADNCADDCKCNNNGICEDGETPAACSLDCSCGNYKCEPELGETVSTCEHDCGCNRNFICESHENYQHCPEDVQRILLRIFQMHLLMKKWRRKFRIVCRCTRMIILIFY